jgi:hypothetical protein
VLLLPIFFLNDRLIFGRDLFFQLGDVLGHSSELHSKLCNLLLGFQEILRVKISVRSNGFIKILLLLQFTFSFNIFLLELGDQIVLEFDLFETTVVSSIGLRSFNTILVLVFFKILDEIV